MPTKPKPGRLSRGVARILHKAYKGSSITQKALAKVAFVDQSQMSKLLRGERTLNMDQLEAVCFELGLSPGEVVTTAELADE